MRTTVILFQSSSITDIPIVLFNSPNPTLYYSLEPNNTIKWRWDWNIGNWMVFYTGQLDEFEDTASGDKKLLALLYDNFLVGCLNTTPQRFLFGLLDDDSGDLQGVYTSSAADSSGVADDSGVFLVKINPDAAAETKSVCVYFRQRGVQFDKKCALDPGNKLRLFCKYSSQFSADKRNDFYPGLLRNHSSGNYISHSADLPQIYPPNTPKDLGKIHSNVCTSISAYPRLFDIFHGNFLRESTLLGSQSFLSKRRPECAIGDCLQSRYLTLGGKCHVWE
jgi:hypothetical protein